MRVGSFDWAPACSRFVAAEIIPPGSMFLGVVDFFFFLCSSLVVIMVNDDL